MSWRRRSPDITAYYTMGISKRRTLFVDDSLRTLFKELERVRQFEIKKGLFAVGYT